VLELSRGLCQHVWLRGLECRACGVLDHLLRDGWAEDLLDGEPGLALTDKGVVAEGADEERTLEPLPSAQGLARTP
jgi:hypothetical protein